MKLFLSIAAVFLFAACTKDNVRSTRSNLLVVNASPNSGTIELLQNLKPAGQFSYVNGFTPTVTYLQVDSGFNNYKLRSSSAEIASWLFSNVGFNNSLFICDTATPARIKYFFLKDDLDTNGLGKQSKIRLVQLSPDLDSVDLVTVRRTNPSLDSTIINNTSYFGKFTQAQVLTSGTFQNFYGDSVLTIKIRRRRNNTIAATYLFNFTKGKIYSFVLKGYDARRGKDSLSLSIVTHN